MLPAEIMKRFRVDTPGQFRLADFAPDETCGLENGSGGNPVSAQDVFWGAAAGPGVDPADLFCGAPTTIAPIRAKEFRPKLKRFR